MTISSSKKPIRRSILLASLLLGLAVVVPLTVVPPSLLLPATVLVSILFVVLPIILLFSVAEAELRTVGTILQLLAGVAATVFCGFLLKRAGAPIEIVTVGGVSQLAVVAWAGAIGTLVALLFRDKNLILPAAAVLAAIDLVIVLTPSGIVHQALQSDQGRKVFEALAYQVPSLGRLQPAAFVGPADFLFVAMFFTVVRRHQMNVRATLIATADALAVYLLIVLLFGHTSIGGVPLRALPALVPVGIAVLAANWNQFTLSKQEKVMTIAVAVICFAFVAYSFSKGSNAKTRTPASDLSPFIQRMHE